MSSTALTLEPRRSAPPEPSPTSASSAAHPSTPAGRHPAMRRGATASPAGRAQAAPKGPGSSATPRATPSNAVAARLEALSGAPDPRVTVKVIGLPNATPVIGPDIPTPRSQVLDVVIVGGGLSGLSALYKLRGKRTLLLEWSSALGGLAAQGQRDGATYARGAAYFAKPEGEVAQLYREIGLGNPQKVKIADPIDSYLADGIGQGRKRVFVEDMWEHGLEKLPEEFHRFKKFLEALSDAGMIGEVPLEEQPPAVLMWDKITAAEMLKDFGPRVKTMLDLYCQSALGTTTDHISAMAFLNFYIDELGPRYAFPGGTGGVAEQLEKTLRRQNPQAIESGAFVYDVHHRDDGLVEVRFVKDGKNQSVLAREVIMATPLSAAAKVITDLPKERHEQFKSMEHANYLVHNVFTPQLIFDKSYDTWTADAAFTDVIVGGWQETSGFADPDSKKRPGILTVYQPLPKEYWNKTLSEDEVRELAMKAYRDLERLFPKLKKQKRTEIESTRWPGSIHIVKPGQISTLAPALREPHGRVLFAGNNLGVPSFEEAIYRGLQAAQEARKRLAARPDRTPVPLP